MKTLGLLINPIAGMGGSVGLKGTDGMYQEAVRRGAVRKANARTALALKALLPIRDDLLVLCPSGEMGEDLAREMGFQVKVVYSCGPDTTAEDTIAAARGLNKTIVPTILVILGSCVFRVFWVYVIFPLGGTTTLLYLLYPVSWTITAIAEITYFIFAYRAAARVLERGRAEL